MSDFGKVKLIGNYKPKENNLEDVTYLSEDGRFYFEDAINSLTNKLNTKSNLIDIDNYMLMKEVIPTASQMKAIYAMDNHIIDGPAGTGKSTSILQKILVLIQNYKISNSNILVLVKHDGLVEPFNNLLINMKVFDIAIMSVSNFLVSNIGNNFNSISVGVIDDISVIVHDIKVFINTIINNKNGDIQDEIPYFLNKKEIMSTLSNYFLSNSNYKYLCDEKESKYKDLILPIKINFEDELFKNKEKLNSIERRKYFYEGINIDREDKDKIQAKINKYVTLMSFKNSSDTFNKEQYDIILEGIKLEIEELEKKIKVRNNKDELISLNDYVIYKINNDQDEYEKIAKDKLTKKLKNVINNSEYLIISENVKRLELEMSSMISIIENNLIDNINKYSSNEEKALIKVLYKDNIKKFNTIIIDEAQDVSLDNIELINKFTQQLILSGDEAQNENKDGIGTWNKLRVQSEFYDNERLLVFKLRHNFRQTYELGNLSYNFRQLMLNYDIEDLKEDYFENQKGFEIPKIKDKNNTISIICDRVNYIKNSFSKTFPLVVISDTDSELKRLKIELEVKGFKVAFCNEHENIDIILINSKKVAGREYPVIVSVLSSNISDNTLYIILSRAKFNLTLIFDKSADMNNKLLTLIDNNLLINEL